MKKVVVKICLVFCLFILFISWGGSSSTLKDGYYTAEAAVFDEYGWKEYLAICVSGGRIILVEYNAYNSSGFVKSWDVDYMRMMNSEDGTYPNAFTRHYGRLLLEKQGTEGIDALSGASNSYPVFLALAEAVIKNAREGNNKTALVHPGKLL